MRTGLRWPTIGEQFAFSSSCSRSMALPDAVPRGWSLRLRRPIPRLERRSNNAIEVSALQRCDHPALRGADRDGARGTVGPAPCSVTLMTSRRSELVCASETGVSGTTPLPRRFDLNNLLLAVERLGAKYPVKSRGGRR